MKPKAQVCKELDGSGIFSIWGGLLLGECSNAASFTPRLTEVDADKRQRAMCKRRTVTERNVTQRMKQETTGRLPCDKKVNGTRTGELEA
jgi:hypothetical protein